jgi:NAD/NADP transhydrogenase alpha subunit
MRLGNKGQRQFTCHLFLLITGNKAEMLVIIVFGLIAQLTAVYGGCVVGSQDLRDFDWEEVGISILI